MAYEKKHGHARYLTLRNRWAGLLKDNIDQLHAGVRLSAVTIKDYQRIIWYYQGLVNGKYDWYALRDVYYMHLKLKIVATDYTQANLWRCCCKPHFEHCLTQMLGDTGQ